MDKTKVDAKIRINGNSIYSMRAAYEDFREVCPDTVINFDNFNKMFPKVTANWKCGNKEVADLK
ncbi:hypothetical protein NQ318_016467 [Aromia moschata]|uniref:Uncharacterized protein n=1 Tax=Aromia moschata TaxID=1265417 RepID=A0AAV8Z5T9_9CUCU|nr:hypothetical protein NQ318_016467 [Aromia moschata]